MAGIDVDCDCRYPYEANNPAIFVEQDIKYLTGTKIKKLFGDAAVTLLAGCAPCQPFSTYSRSARKYSDRNDWELVASFGRIVREVQPHFVTMENVPQVEHHQVFQEFLGSLKGYHAIWTNVECARIGVPQTRKRFVLLASRLGSEELKLHVSSKATITVREAIAGLPTLAAGEADRFDPLHIAC